MSDLIELVLPPSRRFDGVVQLVVGGVGTRCELPYDTVDELQLAVSGVLASIGSEQVVVEIHAGEGVTVAVGPLADGMSTDASLLRVLERLVARVAPERRDGREWLTLHASVTD